MTGQKVTGPNLPLNEFHPFVEAKQISVFPNTLQALRPRPREANQFGYKNLWIQVSPNLVVSSGANDSANNASTTCSADDKRKSTGFQQSKHVTEVIKACKCISRKKSRRAVKSSFKTMSLRTHHCSARKTQGGPSISSSCALEKRQNLQSMKDRQRFASFYCRSRTA